jgi:uncharacterized membrane protein YeaQ/YmgE (transglycosylase-associated protein family)
MSIISWIILGLIAGFIGSKIVNTQGQGLMLDIALGVVGAIVGGVLFSFFGATGITGLNLYSLLVAIVRFGGGSLGLSRLSRSSGGLSQAGSSLHTRLERAKGIEPSYAAWEARWFSNKSKG